MFIRSISQSVTHACTHTPLTHIHVIIPIEYNNNNNKSSSGSGLTRSGGWAGE